MHVGLIPDHIVLDGDSPPLTQRDTAPPIFEPSVVAKWLDGLRCQLHGMAQATLLDGDPAPLPKKGAEPLPNFWPMSIVVKRLNGSRRHLARRWALLQATLC